MNIKPNARSHFKFIVFLLLTVITTTNIGSILLLIKSNDV